MENHHFQWTLRTKFGGFSRQLGYIGLPRGNGLCPHHRRVQRGQDRRFAPAWFRRGRTLSEVWTVTVGVLECISTFGLVQMASCMMGYTWFDCNSQTLCIYQYIYIYIYSYIHKHLGTYTWVRVKMYSPIHTLNPQAANPHRCMHACIHPCIHT